MAQLDRGSREERIDLLEDLLNSGDGSCGAGEFFSSRTHQVSAGLRQPLGERFGRARFRTDVLEPVLIGKLLVPADQAELFGVHRAQPPMIGFAFQVQAVVAAIGALNFHTSYYILP